MQENKPLRVLALMLGTSMLGVLLGTVYVSYRGGHRAHSFEAECRAKLGVVLTGPSGMYCVDQRVIVSVR